MKKRIIASILSIGMVAAITGCSGSSTPASSKSGDSPAASTQAASSPEAGGGTAATDFPTHDINAFLTWGAGGGLDTTFRALVPHVEKELGVSVVVQNKTGASGAVACQFVYDQKSDGYSIFGGAESPTMFNIMDLSKLDYRN